MQNFHTIHALHKAKHLNHFKLWKAVIFNNLQRRAISLFLFPSNLNIISFLLSAYNSWLIEYNHALYWGEKSLWEVRNLSPGLIKISRLWPSSIEFLIDRIPSCLNIENIRDFCRPQFEPETETNLKVWNWFHCDLTPNYSTKVFLQ